MEPIKDASHLYEVERRARHAERPGFRISELQISATQNPKAANVKVEDLIDARIIRKLDENGYMDKVAAGYGLK